MNGMSVTIHRRPIYLPLRINIHRKVNKSTQTLHLLRHIENSTHLREVVTLYSGNSSKAPPPKCTVYQLVNRTDQTYEPLVFRGYERGSRDTVFTEVSHLSLNKVLSKKEDREGRVHIIELGRCNCLQLIT